MSVITIFKRKEYNKVLSTCPENEIINYAIKILYKLNEAANSPKNYILISDSLNEH